MAAPAVPTSRDGFKIAIICALQVEAQSVRAMFERCYDDEGLRFGEAEGDKNTYTTGVVGGCKVVLILLLSMGSVSAARAATSLTTSFPRIELVLVVGVCGAVPINSETGEEICLGDVIISTALVQYDFGRRYPDTFEHKTSVKDSLRKAPMEMQGFMDKISMSQNLQRLQSDLVRLVQSDDFLLDETIHLMDDCVQRSARVLGVNHYQYLQRRERLDQWLAK